MNFKNMRFEDGSFRWRNELLGSNGVFPASEGLHTPVNLRVTNQTTDSISLAWDASIGSVTVLEYEIFRDGIRIATVPSQTLTYTDTELIPNTQYLYTVRAVTASEHSGETTGSTSHVGGGTHPGTSEGLNPPTNLSITNQTANSISLAWNASIGSVLVSNYEIFRDGVKIADVTSQMLTYTDTGLMPHTQYHYTVRAVAVSEHSNQVTGTTSQTEGGGVIPTPNGSVRFNVHAQSNSFAATAQISALGQHFLVPVGTSQTESNISPNIYMMSVAVPTDAINSYSVQAPSSFIVNSNSETVVDIFVTAIPVAGGGVGGGVGADDGASGSFNGLRPIPRAQAPANAKYVQVPRNIWSPNPETSPEAASNRLSQYLSRTDFDQLFANRYGRGEWFPINPGHMPVFDYYSYDNLQAAITRLANIVVIVEHRAQRADAWRLLVLHKENNPNNEALLVYEYEHWNEDWFANNGPIITQVADFGSFLGEPNRNDRLREIAAFLANVTQETSGGTTGTESRLTHGLWFIDEVGYGAAFPTHFGYAQAHHPIWPAHPNRSYHGRGPMQLSWNFNYGLFSDIFFKDANVLLNDPSLVADNGIVGWMTAIGFWMLPQPPKPSCHEVMTTGWTPSPLDITRGRTQPGFGMTIMIINGGLEGNLTTADPRIWTRVSMYQRIAGRNGANIAGEKLDTQGMLAFP